MIESHLSSFEVFVPLCFPSVDRHLELKPFSAIRLSYGLCWNK